MLFTKQALFKPLGNSPNIIPKESWLSKVYFVLLAYYTLFLLWVRCAEAVDRSYLAVNCRVPPATHQLLAKEVKTSTSKINRVALG